MIVASLYRRIARLPDLDSPIFRASHHPFSLTVESDTGDVARVALKAQHRIGIRGLYIEELDGVVARGGNKAFVGRDAETVDLRVGVLHCA
ncbi:hypothetical protein RRF57_010131 [Xylaria bambusicola]|uniref:Uncharacterized protein n=1 Tax=Xylaria bambusicola TaxID=326684 RepID=A0AAN7ZCK1_9PEZI